MFGLAMGLATVFVIPWKDATACWLSVCLLSAWIIARRCTDRRFLHGFTLGLANIIWTTGAHVLFTGRYLVHAQEVDMRGSLPMTIGIFAIVAGRLVKPSAAG
jgi:hypothetical protein